MPYLNKEGFKKIRGQNVDNFKWDLKQMIKQPEVNKFFNMFFNTSWHLRWLQCEVEFNNPEASEWKPWVATSIKCSKDLGDTFQALRTIFDSVKNCYNKNDILSIFITKHCMSLAKANMEKVIDIMDKVCIYNGCSKCSVENNEDCPFTIENQDHEIFDCRGLDDIQCVPWCH